MERQDISSLGLDGLIAREWLATNQLGGYASSTLAGLNTRKYHGLLVAAMAPPVRRMVLLGRVQETVICQSRTYELGVNEYPGIISPQGHRFLRAFSTEPYPRWAYQADGWTIEKTLRLLLGQNTVVLSYCLLGGDVPVDLELRPLFAMRSIHELMYQWEGKLEVEIRSESSQRIGPTVRTPEVFFSHDGQFSPEAYWYLSNVYRREGERGYNGLEDLWMPGVVRWRVAPGQSVHFICSADPIDFDRAIGEAEKLDAAAIVPCGVDPDLDALMHAADQFVVRVPEGGTQSTTVVTQYPWSPPSGRDAMICFTGLLLVPGRFAEAISLLRLMVSKLKDGLMPTDFPEESTPPLYRGADVSLWFINAVHEYFRYTSDEQGIRGDIYDAIDVILKSYFQGTDLGISVDSDGLLMSHAAGVGATWMDAAINNWVITPRQGRAVELNALWYNALRIGAMFAGRFGQAARAEELLALAERVRTAFNRRFWNDDAKYLFDVLEVRGPHSPLRPNQLLAMSLAFPVLSDDRCVAVLEKVQAELLIPVGVRTLSPRDPSYQGHCSGNVVARDRALHQGSAYPWLLGHFISTYLRVRGRDEKSRLAAKALLDPCLRYLQGPGVGQICELFDGDGPHAPGGAIASSRAVGELLRCYVEDILDRRPSLQPRKAGPTSPRMPTPTAGQA